MKTFAALLVTFLTGSAGVTDDAPLAWSTLGAGCHERGLSEVLLMPDDSETAIDLTDIRIGRLPDTHQGPGFLVHFRRHLDGPLGQSTGRPELFLAVGDWKRSCSILIDQEACTGASDVYASLATQNIPIGFAFDDPRPITVLHGTMYFLSARDGHGNQTDWRYYGEGHPLKEVVATSLDQLETCAKPAKEALQKQEPSP
ncbi:MAG TPA: hypothetical protein VJ766_10125 [Pseudoxanthomonas sp.]|nr:hypothetical protein [Pseudoxanthomonas sp.]